MTEINWLDVAIVLGIVYSLLGGSTYAVWKYYQWGQNALRKEGKIK